MDKFYKKVMFDCTQLIINKHYKRAITLCEFLLSKGYRTGELIATLSYARKMIEGPDAAIKVLKSCMVDDNQSEETNKNRLLNSPLVQLAMVEYNIENENLKQALNALQGLKVLEQETEDENQSTLLSILKTMRNNYVQIYEGSNLSKIVKQNKQNGNSLSQTVQNFKNQINEITQNYLCDKDVSNEKDQPEFSQTASKYGQYFLQYDDIRQRILTLLSSSIKIDSQNLFNVRSSKKTKFLNNSSHISGKKLKKQSTKELFFKETKQSSSLQKKGNKQANKEKLFSNTDHIKQKSVPQNYIEQLQTLLLQVNRFINFFKNRIKDYGASRIKQISPKKLQINVE